jgi:hypothetical protein
MREVEASGGRARYRPLSGHTVLPRSGAVLDLGASRSRGAFWGRVTSQLAGMPRSAPRSAAGCRCPVRPAKGCHGGRRSTAVPPIARKKPRPKRRYAPFPGRLQTPRPRRRAPSRQESLLQEHRLLLTDRATLRHHSGRLSKLLPRRTGHGASSRSATVAQVRGSIPRPGSDVSHAPSISREGLPCSSEVTAARQVKPQAALSG